MIPTISIFSPSLLRGRDVRKRKLLSHVGARSPFLLLRVSIGYHVFRLSWLVFPICVSFTSTMSIPLTSILLHFAIRFFFGQCSMRDFHSLRKLANGYWHYMPWHQSHWTFPFMPWRFQFSLVKKRTRESGHGPDGGLQTSCRPAVGSAAFDSASKNSRERSPLPVCRARYLRYCEALGEREHF